MLQCLTFLIKEFNQSRLKFSLFSNSRIQSNKNQPYAFVIDGDTLSYLFKYNLEVKFCQVCLECEAVLCCRLSPAQKASVSVIYFDITLFYC